MYEKASVLGVWLLVAGPSLKLIYSTPIINFIAVFILFSAVCLRRKVSSTLETKLLVSLIGFFFIILFFGFFNGLYVNSARDLVYHIFFLLAVVLVIPLANWFVLSKVGFFVFLWGLALALWQLTIGIKYEEELGQNYLTASMPMGAALAYSLRFLFGKESNFIKKLFYLFCFIIIFVSTSTLLSRSPLIFVFSIIALFSFSILFKWFPSPRFWAYLSFTAICGIASTYFFISNIHLFSQGERVLRLLNYSDQESRVQLLYLPAIRNIKEKPFLGYGTNSSDSLYGIYPHNMFLEVLSIGGIVLFVPFFLFVVFFFVCVWRTIIDRSASAEAYGLTGFVIYLFLQFNTSFSILNIYIFMSPAIIFIFGVLEMSKRRSFKTGLRAA